VTVSTLSPKGRALVHVGRRAFQPTDADRVRLLSALRSKLGDAALPADLSPVTSAASAGRTIWPFISAVVVGVGILGGALFFARQGGLGRDNPKETNLAPATATTQVTERAAIPSAAQPTISGAMPPAAVPPAASAHRSQDRLAAEVALLSRATRDLHAGRAVEVLETLDEYRRKFPRGLLNNDHRAARVQALCALGRFNEANAELAGLAPQSLLAVRAKQFCDASRERRSY
jgi:hypothetical protein